MSLVASDWLALSLILCVAAYAANRRFITLLLPIAVAMSAAAVWLPTGSPRFTRPPPAEYTVLGAKMVPNVGIWVLLDDGRSEPTYFRLPWSTAQANALQQAQDAAGEGGSVKAKVSGEGGGVEYDGEPPVTGDETKTPEQPALTLP